MTAPASGRPSYDARVTPHRPRLFGHRGSPLERHENTLEGFDAALAAGLDGVELDVQRTLDGMLVVHHDPHLPDGRLIAALRAREVADAELPRGGRVPTFDSVLEWAGARGAWLNVEVKTGGAGTDGREHETARAIRRHGLDERVLVSSFSPLAVARVRAAAPRLATALVWAPDLRPAWALANGRYAALLGVSAVHPHHSLVDARLIARARRRGWAVHVWTVNDAALGGRLLGLGVDGLIGDRPEVLLEAAGRTAAA